MKKIAQLMQATYRHFMRDSLYRNSFYLLANLAVTALTGFCFVVLCTHLYSPKDFGFATALIGLMSLVVSLSNIGMNRTIVRFLGQSRARSQDIITKTFLVGCTALAMAVAASFLLPFLGLPRIGIGLNLLFIAATVLMSLKNVLDNVFVAIRAASGTLTENGLFSLTKLAAPALLVGAGFLGVFSAQLAGAIIAIAASIVLLRYRFNMHVARPHRSSMNGKWQFAIGSYVSDLIGSLPASVLPVLVVARFGPIAGALWYVVMQIINLLLMVSSSINQAMFAELAHTVGHIGPVVRKAALAMYGLLVPMTICVFIFSPVALNIFSHTYNAGTGLLRLMSLFALLGVSNYLTGSILALYKKVFYLTFVNIINAIIVVCYSLWIARDLQGIAVGWMLGEGANLFLFAGGAIYFSRRVTQIRTAQEEET